jgi:CBS domain-containing protein
MAPNMNTPATPPLIFESVRDFLVKHAPYSQMRDDALAFFIPRLKLAYFAKDSVIVDRDTTDFTPLFIIQRGTVASQTAGLDTLPDRVLGAGESFPVGALSAGGKPTRSYRAVDDVFAFVLPLHDFEALRKMSPEFAAFCAEAVTVLAQQSLAELQRHYSQVATDQQSLTRPLGELVRRDPVTCTVTATLRDAIVQMREHAVRSCVVVDDAQHARGMLTLNDLRDRVLLEDVPLDTLVTKIATPDPTTLPVHASAADAIQLMATTGHHQVIVTDHGRVRGIVSERDLFSLQRVSLQQVHRAIRSARSIGSLKRAAGDIRNLTRNLLAQGVGAEALTRTIAAMNDALTRQVLVMTRQNHPSIDVPWCWLALGSEGRGEQTLATDQDNAIIFAAPDPATADRKRHLLLSFAQEVNDALAELGFPLCSGGIMASNPHWCLSEEEWRQKFIGWLTEPTPPALLNANIFFDFRPLLGESRLADTLRAWLLARTGGNPLFLKLMVANALQTEPPLGLIRAFVVDETDNKFDLKSRGTRVFVDAARVFALARGLGDTGTVERLRNAGAQLGIEPRHVAATVDAFQYLQLLRLRTQEGAPDSVNRVDPYQLNEVDQRMLQEALRQARKLQQRLQTTYATF